jgi:hypothetical protein
MTMPPLPLAIAIMGPTASGKTAAALAIARAIPSEIISVDSALVYRGMDIGTAKPTAAERAPAPHHLIDILDPAESYSAMQFRTAALQLVSEILARGNLPLLVGGTMLYFKALRDGLDTLPEADPDVRAALDADAALIGSPGMHARLALLDPVTAARLKPNDAQRIQRALEIHQLTGQPMSSLLAQANDFIDQIGTVRCQHRIEAGGDALRWLSPGLGIPRRPDRPGRAARKRPGRHPSTGQTPAHLAAGDTGTARDRLPRPASQRTGTGPDRNCPPTANFALTAKAGNTILSGCLVI